jgi:hypothetical protein
MGLLEYRAKPYLSGMAHDCVLYTFCERSAPDWGKWCCPSGQVAWTVRHIQITPARSLSSSQPGGPPCWPSPLAFGLIGWDTVLPTPFKIIRSELWTKILSMCQNSFFYLIKMRKLVNLKTRSVSNSVQILKREEFFPSSKTFCPCSRKSL